MRHQGPHRNPAQGRNDPRTCIRIAWILCVFLAYYPQLSETLAKGRGEYIILIAILGIIAGLALLVWSAGRFIDGASVAASHARVPPLIIGMVIIGFGTSLPELIVSTMAALDGSPELAIGNALGSNIVNIGLILGITAVIHPIVVHSSVVRRELPLLLITCLAFGGLVADASLPRTDACLLLLAFAGFLGWTLVTGLRSSGDSLTQDSDAEIEARKMPLGAAIFWVIIGLLLLLLGSRLLVWSAETIARSLGISDLIIGLTIVAVGTSLPELVTSVMAARKGEHDMAIGNIIGSNMFNLLAVVGCAAAVTPVSELSPAMFTRDWLSMLLLTLALIVMSYGFGRPGRINRVEGVLLLVTYVLYNGWLVFSSI